MPSSVNTEVEGNFWSWGLRLKLKPRVSCLKMTMLKSLKLVKFEIQKAFSWKSLKLKKLKLMTVDVKEVWNKKPLKLKKGEVEEI